MEKTHENHWREKTEMANTLQEERTPKYVKVIAYIQKMIDEGKWSMHHKLPSEDTLADQFSMSRGTVRQAVSELVRSETLYRIHGRGTFVGPERIDLKMSSPGTTSFLQGFSDKGIEFSANQISIAVVPASALPDKSFKFPESENLLIRICRLRKSGGTGLMYSENYIPFHRFPEFAERDFSAAGLHNAIESEYGVIVSRTVRNLSAAAAGRQLAGYLEIKPDSPTLFAEQISFDQYGKCVDYALIWMRSDKMHITMEFDRSGTIEMSSSPV